MTKKLTLLFFICFLSALNANAQDYSGYVGDVIQIPMPYTSLGRITDTVWENPDPKCLSVNGSIYGGATITINKYFSVNTYIPCNIYYETDSPGYTYRGHTTVYYSIACLPTKLTGIPEIITLSVGEKKTINWSYSPSYSKKPEVTWQTDDYSIASVNEYNGEITAIKEGETTITAINKSGNNEEVYVIVKKELSDGVKVTKISLSSTSVSLSIGNTKQLTSTIYPSDATDKSVTWSSNNSSVATVNSSTGLVKAKSVGLATITCKANDGSGILAKCYVTVSSPIIAEINEENFPSKTFRKWLLKQKYGSDGVLTEAEIAGVTSIDVSGNSSSTPGEITSLKGIEFFTKLEELKCYYNKITSLDVSGCTALKRLWCLGNKLTSLNVSGCTALKFLHSDNNNLTSIDVSGCTSLTQMRCNYNQLTSLDVSECTALDTLWCIGNQLTSLDVSKNTALRELFCSKNQLTSLDVSKNTALTNLEFHLNQIKGAAMDALIESLPTNNGGIMVVINYIDDQNIMTTNQVAVTNAKGWKTYCMGEWSWEEYAGSQPDEPAKKCATPTITIADGKIKFACETEGVEFIYNAAPSTALSGNGDEAPLLTKYTMSVYATKDGYENSEVATKEIDLGTNGLRGDLNGDGDVNLPDAMFIVNKILNGKFPDE